MKGTVYPHPYLTVTDEKTGRKKRVPAKAARDTTWAYSFSVGGRENRRHFTKRGFPTKTAAQAALTEALSAFQRGEHVELSRMTVRQYLVDEWLPIQASKLKPTTLKGYTDIVNGRLVPHLGDVRLSELSAGQVARMYAALRADGNRRGKRTEGEAKPLSERSIKHTHTVLGKALEDAARRRLIARNPVRDVDAPKPRNAEMKVWTSDEVRTFLASVDDDRLRPLYLLALTTGLRKGELLGLRWDDIDLETGQMAVRRARVAAGYEVHEGVPKSGRARTVAIDPQTVEVLKAQAERQGDECQAWGEAWTDTGYLFTAEDGQPLHPQTLSWHFEKALRSAKVPAIRFHDMRHTHATLALKAGVHPKVVQERLGHSSISITLDLYTHVVPGMQEEAAALVAAEIFG